MVPAPASLADGRHCHQDFRRERDARNLDYECDRVCENFQLGSGHLVTAHQRWIYPVCVAGQWIQLSIYELESSTTALVDMQGLCGPAELALWNAKLDFSNFTM